MNVWIKKSNNAYIPEAFAYADYLKKQNFNVVLSEDDLGFDSFDVSISFMGFLPAWGNNALQLRGAQVHEYHSLSTPPYARAKDFLKRTLNKKPNGRIFLNDTVKESMGFCDDVPFICRDMGVEAALFDINNKDAIFDVIYCGSIDGREGLVDEILRLADLNLKILVVGKANKDNVCRLNNKNVEMVGAIPRELLPLYYAKARAGLNFTPDIYPYNIQTSTKVLEYCAAGLGVISNEYAWIKSFSHLRAARFLFTDELNHADDLRNFSFQIPDVSDLEWSVVLDNIDFKGFLLRVAGR
jgi:hypothetical protein